ncbi:GNAT family N-acetyltransferase [Halodesulfurarchaeum formicicum]|uniref:GCN5 family acetyltransferase n=1 Tax=Halodesulfurarchaeum formicicum TaxID=1873524 RepID=A0A1J1AEK8_9EURY|nr:GNAT family N-acetyltransferase [Halodesulfurarchaeum formicicum]APE96151.1 GCN5 family acetyltransferase [Halodesulfurarchaeum formicicum]
MTDRRYPDAPAGPFPTPPQTWTDEDGRPIEIEVCQGDRAALLEMYADFDPAERAQGIPPVGESAIRDWLDHLLCENCYNVIAEHEDRIVGHATLVGDGNGAYELAIFVHQDYQGAGIGTTLLEALLGHAAADGVEYVWLTVERWNKPAIRLYRKVGFEGTGAEDFEREMSIRLGDPA